MTGGGRTGREVHVKRLMAVLASLIGIVALAVPTTAAARGDGQGVDRRDTFGSVEPIANPAALDTRPLRERSLEAQFAFAQRVFECGVVHHVVEALDDTGAISTINRRNTTFAVSVGGFAGGSSPAITSISNDRGRRGVSEADITVLSNALGYVFSQGSAFLLDGDDPDSFDFPANYVLLRFDSTPPIQQPAALFETVGRIDPALFETDSSGYTQYGSAYLSLQSAVPDEQFIAGYAQAAAEAGVEYTPIVDGEPGLFQGGAAFPANDWSLRQRGEDYLGRIPEASHRRLARIRANHLGVTELAVQIVRWGRPGWDHSEAALIRVLDHLPCRFPPGVLPKGDDLVG